uniref:Uncharacterized protein n=1 Tax=Tetranychus urticae TaxID=32264 RepID=T1KPK3_TETUR
MFIGCLWLPQYFYQRLSSQRIFYQLLMAI